MTSLRVLFAVTLTLVICECATVRSLRATNSGGVRLSRSQGSWRIQARPHSFDDVYEEERDHSLALAPSSGLDGSGSVGEVLKGAPGSWADKPALEAFKHFKLCSHPMLKHQPRKRKWAERTQPRVEFCRVRWIHKNPVKPIGLGSPTLCVL